MDEVRFPELRAVAGPGAAATTAEIAQQPAVWRALPLLLDGYRAQSRSFLEPLLATPELRVVLAGAGSSAFVGEILAPGLTRSLGRRVDAVATTDIVADPRGAFAPDVPTLLVSIARSGNSPESSWATRLADQCLEHVSHLVVTCDDQGLLAQEHASRTGSHTLLMPPETNDRGLAMTSSFTSMLLATWLTLAPVPAETASQLVERLASAAEEVLGHASTLSRIWGEGYDRVVYLGSGPLTGLAEESALKMLELTGGRVATWYDSALGFRHGPKSLLNDRSLAVVYESNDDYTRHYDHDIVAELRHSLGPQGVVVVSAHHAPTADDSRASSLTFSMDGLGGIEDALLALPFVVFAQLLALRSSVALGLEPDNPFPQGEVTRVVQGVTIHPFLP